MTNQPEQTTEITISELRDMYFFLGQIASIAAENRKKLQPLIIKMMGDKPEIMTPDGWTFAKEERVSREYDIRFLRVLFDQDQLDVILKPDTRAVAKLAKELKLPKEKLSELEKNTVVTGTTEALKLKPPTKETMGLIRE